MQDAVTKAGAREKTSIGNGKTNGEAERDRGGEGGAAAKGARAKRGGEERIGKAASAGMAEAKKIRNGGEEKRGDD